ncbi:MAG: DUF4337 family protein [Burkholderiaceae bacterium]
MSRSTTSSVQLSESEPGTYSRGGLRRQASSVGRTGLGGGSMTTQVAVCVMFVALIAATFAYLASQSQLEATHSRNEAMQRRTQAAVQLSDFHARRTDQALAELARDLVEPARKPALQARADALKEETTLLQTQAQKLTSEAVLWDERSDLRLLQQHRWIEAILALQGALVLAAIALLTRKIWLECAMIASALVGVALGGVALLFL